MNPAFTYCGYIGSFLLAILLFPQVYRTFKTKDVEGISSVFIVIEIVTTSLWFVYGLGIILDEDINGVPIIISNSSLLLCSLLLLYGKIKYRKRIKDGPKI